MQHFVVWMLKMKHFVVMTQVVSINIACLVTLLISSCVFKSKIR